MPITGGGQTDGQNESVEKNLAERPAADGQHAHRRLAFAATQQRVLHRTSTDPAAGVPFAVKAPQQKNEL